MSPTEAFQILASADRQYLLQELIDKDGETTVEGLSQAVAAQRHRISYHEISDEEVERAQTRLHHVHLPKLDENNIITINRSTGKVVLNDGAPVDQLLEAAKKLEKSDPDYRMEIPPS